MTAAEPDPDHQPWKPNQFRVADVARRLGVTESTVQKHAATDPPRIVGTRNNVGHWRFTEAAVADYQAWLRREGRGEKSAPEVVLGTSDVARRLRMDRRTVIRHASANPPRLVGTKNADGEWEFTKEAVAAYRAWLAESRQRPIHPSRPQAATTSPAPRKPRAAAPAPRKAPPALPADRLSLPAFADDAVQAKAQLTAAGEAEARRGRPAPPIVRQEGDMFFGGES